MTHPPPGEPRSHEPGPDVIGEVLTAFGPDGLTPRADLLLGRAAFERPLVDAASQRALQGLQRLHAQPDRRVWFCGSYAQAGIPLLESAVRSALEVSRRLGGERL